MEKIAVVTGGAGGMGLATARILGRDATVVISDIGAERLSTATSTLSDEGVDVHSVECDVTDRAAVDELFDRAAALGTVTSVVHTAGISPLMGEPERIVRINAAGTANVTDASLRVASEGLGHVNVASMAAHLFPAVLRSRRAYAAALDDPDAMVAGILKRVGLLPESQRAGMAYSLSKDFVVWYSATMAPGFGRRGARIVSVSPGSFDTEMGRLEEASGSGEMLRFAALPRFGTPEEIAEVLAFCAGPKPGYLTGTDILCDGGVVAGTTWKDLLRLGRGG